MMPRALVRQRGGLVVVDWSYLVRNAWEVGGTSKTASIVIGRVARLLSDPMPDAIVLAVDPRRELPDKSTVRGWTFRDDATAELPEHKRYKANRPPEPPEFAIIQRRLLDVMRAHRIPVLEPASAARKQDYEADDAAAAAVRIARAEGRAVALLARDKDWLQCVSTEDMGTPPVIRWWPFLSDAERQRGEVEEWGNAEVRKRFDVEPSQIADYLAMVGDSGDNVDGVPGIGAKKAAKILFDHGSLDVALTAEPITKDEQRLHAHRDAALSARSLVRLWDQAPVLWDADEQMVGGFDARRIAYLYREFGFTRLEREIPTFPKEPFYTAA
jgi:DNA polymerase-1